MVDDGRLTWLDWRNGGAELLMLRDLAPSVSAVVFAAAWRCWERADTPEARDDVLELLAGAEARAKEARDC